MSLIDLLDAAGLTQADLARELAVHRAAVNAWIARGRVPAERLADVATALKLKPADAQAFYLANGIAVAPVLTVES